MAQILGVLAGPFAVLYDIVLEDLDSLVINVLPSKELSLFVHSHIYPDVSMKTKHDQGFVILFQVLQVLVKVIHGSRHDDGNSEVADALLVDGERDDLVWLIRKVKQPNTSDEKLESMKRSENEAFVVFSHKKTVGVIDCYECSQRRCDELQPGN